MKCTLLMFAFVLHSAVFAQPRLVGIEQLPVDSTIQWAHPKFSSDGSRILFTRSDFAGVWSYAIQAKQAVQLTADAGSGSAFDLSADGTVLAYRRTIRPSPDRIQKLVQLDIVSGAKSILSSSSSVSAPTVVGKAVVSATRIAESAVLLRKSSAKPVILGIEDTRIVLLVNGAKKVLDPYGDGHYIWPALSPDGDKLVAYDQDRGTFVCDLEGRIISKLGRRDAAVWTRSGKWLMFMDERDDGRSILSSDIWYISPNGTSSGRLMTAPGTIAFDPSCSSTENRIVCSTADGRILLLTYEEN